jgi:hypothetical protein
MSLGTSTLEDLQERCISVCGLATESRRLCSVSLAGLASCTRSLSKCSPRANSSSLESLPASTSARIDRCALYSLFSIPALLCSMRQVRLANCCFDHNSLGFPVLLRFCDARSGRSFRPLHRYPGSLARTWRRSFHRCGVASPQAPTPDPESLQAPIAESMRVGPHPRRFDGALGVSYSSAPLRNRTEVLNSARPSKP